MLIHIKSHNLSNSKVTHTNHIYWFRVCCKKIMRQISVVKKYEMT